MAQHSIPGQPTTTPVYLSDNVVEAELMDSSYARLLGVRAGLLDMQRQESENERQAADDERRSKAERERARKSKLKLAEILATLEPAIVAARVAEGSDAGFPFATEGGEAARSQRCGSWLLSASSQAGRDFRWRFQVPFVFHARLGRANWRATIRRACSHRPGGESQARARGGASVRADIAGSGFGRCNFPDWGDQGV